MDNVWILVDNVWITYEMKVGTSSEPGIRTVGCDLDRGYDPCCVLRWGDGRHDLVFRLRHGFWWEMDGGCGIGYVCTLVLIPVGNACGRIRRRVSRQSSLPG